MKIKKKFLLITLSMLVLAMCSVPIAGSADTVDDRQWMHGINFVDLQGKKLLVFSSNKYTPVTPGDEWQDDIYYSWVDPNNTPSDGILSKSNVKTLVSAKYAQEPASAAVDSNGELCVTAEDAEFHPDDLDQTFGVWDSSLNAIKKYGVPLMTGCNSDNQGGHSGHVAASGNKFLVTFCDGWIDGGGVDNLGTGDDIYARVVNENGSMGSIIKTAVDAANVPDRKRSRDWWPIVAGSDQNWLQVWQKYGTAGEGSGTIWGALTSQSGQIVKKFQITDNNKYYYYDVCYIPSISRYLVTGSRMDGGFASLIDKNGNIISTTKGLPNTVREAKTIIHQGADGNIIGAYPIYPTGVAVLNITANSVTLNKTIANSTKWDYMGTDGFFTSDTSVLFATGTQKGIKFVNVDFDD